MVLLKLSARSRWLSPSIAPLAVAAFVAVAPSVALADNECDPINPSANGAAADSFTCTPAESINGIRYSSNGNLTVTTTAGFTLLTNNIQLTGNGADNVAFNSNGGAILSNVSTLPVLDIRTDMGAIAINSLVGVRATPGGGPFAIRATSTGGGDIIISTGAVSLVSSSPVADTALEAVTNGGDIRLITTELTNVGRVRGISLRTSGAGAVNIVNTGGITVSNTVGVAAVEVVAGTGGANISFFRSGALGSGADGGSGNALRVVSAGAITVNNGQFSRPSGLRALGTTNWIVDLATTGGPILFNNANGSIFSTQGSVGNTALAIRATGGPVTLNNDARIGGVVSFAGSTSSIFNNSASSRDNPGGGWRTAGTSTFTDGADVFNNLAPGGGRRGGSVHTSENGIATTFAFGAGADVFNNGGILSVGESFGEARLTMTGLETFNNSSGVYFGINSISALTPTSDGSVGDLLSMPGAHFVGLAGSRLFMDADLSQPQVSCAGALTSDCFSLPGGTTSGITQITVNDVSGAPLDYNPLGIVLVDVSGGSSAAGHFVLAPDSDHYAGGILTDGGPVFFALVYDAATQTHRLVTPPQPETFQLGSLGQIGEAAWLTSWQAWDREEVAVRPGGRVWVRMAADAADRDLIQTYDSFGTVYSFDVGYAQDTVAALAGADFSLGGFTVGVMGGVVDSDVDSNAPSQELKLAGHAAAVYGRFVWGGLRVTGLYGTSRLSGRMRLPALTPAGDDDLPVRTETLGGDLEIAWRLPLGAGFFVEPMANLAYAETDTDPITLNDGATAVYETLILDRQGLGVRFGVTEDHGFVTGTYVLSARRWSEGDGIQKMAVENIGTAIPIIDAFDEALTDILFSARWTTPSGAVAAIVEAGGRYGDTYDSSRISAGFALRW